MPDPGLSDQSSMGSCYFPEQILQQRLNTPVPVAHIHSRSLESKSRSFSQLDLYQQTKNFMVQTPFCESSPSKVTRPRISPKQWDEQRLDIEEHYINQEKSLLCTMEFVSEKYENHAK